MKRPGFSTSNSSANAVTQVMLEVRKNKSNVVSEFLIPDFNSKKVSDRCSAKDISAKFGPVRDQGDTGWCYAYSIADLVGFYENKRISASEIALQNNRGKVFDLDLAGADLSQALNTSFAKGFCLESDMPSEGPGHTSIYTILKQYELSYRQARDKNTLCSDTPNSILPNGVIELFRQVSSIVANSEYSQALIRANCRNRLISNLKAEDLTTSDHDTMAIISGINNQLNSDEPSLIAFRPGDLKFSAFNRGSQDAHTALVVGRKFDPVLQECQYLLRNSYGPNWNVCSPTSDCPNGHIWVSEGDLKGVLTEAHRIVSKPK